LFRGSNRLRPMVRYTESEVTDDPQFLDWVEAVVIAVEKTFKTDLAFVVKIDNRFGKSGKTIRRELTKIS